MHRTAPCLLDPRSWDLDPGQGPHRPVEHLISACLNQCPALDLCRQLDRGDCYGVVAGEYRPWPADKVLAASFRQSALKRIVAAIQASVAAAKPGYVLPGAAELARLYGVSETTVRSALLELADQQILTRPATRHQWYRVPDRTENAA